MSYGRTVAFAGLAGFGLLHWMALLAPAEPVRAAVALAVALLVVARPMLLALALPAALLAGGVQVRELWPGNWDELAATLGAGVDLVGSVQLPYRGSDAAVRLVLGVGGALLALSAALVARRWWLPGLLLLGCLYGIPSVAVGFDAQFARGAVLAVLIVAYVCADRLRVDDFAPAMGLAIGVAVVALAAAPALDSDRPWFDYEAFAARGGDDGTTSFKWEHDYGALIWPREGREMLEVASPRRTYWKAETLDRFTSGHWSRDPTAGAPLGGQNVGVDADNRARWSYDIAVSVRGLESDTMPLAAVATSVEMAGETPRLEAPGIWHAGRTLRSGDSFTARVYVPDPSAGELAAAPAPLTYPRSITENLSIEVPRRGRENISVVVRGFGDSPQADYFDAAYADEQLRESSLGRTWDLSRELLQESETPFAYLQAVRRHLSTGFFYDETPPRESSTLDGFLFESRIGFCQHFSGAMALMLRMGGVPARVAVGFAPGSFDESSKRYLVRDVDAHSWVEAWFEGIGWVVFDPTPAAAPPRSQALPGAITAGVGDRRDLGTTQSAGTPRRGDRARAADRPRVRGARRGRGGRVVARGAAPSPGLGARAGVARCGCGSQAWLDVVGCRSGPALGCTPLRVGIEEGEVRRWPGSLGPGPSFAPASACGGPWPARPAARLARPPACVA